MSEKMSELNLKQSELSRITKISKNAISNYVNDVRIPDTISAYKLSQALHVPIEWLLTGEKSFKDEKIFLNEIPYFFRFNSFDRRLKEIISNSTFTNEEVCDMLEIDCDTITNYINKKSFLDVNLLFTLCKILNTSADWLLFGVKNRADEDETKNTNESVQKLSNEELNLINKYRKLDSNDHEEIQTLLDLKHKRIFNKSNQVSNSNHSTGNNDNKFIG
ncbi:MAG: helix-turn-helix domain-containing protein [Eubacteriaceae bacterium]